MTEGSVDEAAMTGNQPRLWSGQNGIEGELTFGPNFGQKRNQFLRQDGLKDKQDQRLSKLSIQASRLTLSRIVTMARKHRRVSTLTDKSVVLVNTICEQPRQ